MTEAKSLLEQVALVSQGRSMYLTCLSSIARYVREDLLGGTITGGDASRSDKSKISASPSVTPSVILSARPVDDPLESILYLTSVGIPGHIYDTVRSLRQARSRRLGAMQRKVPTIHILMMWIIGVTLILTFPTLIGVGGTSWATLPSTGFNIRTIEGILFGVGIGEDGTFGALEDKRRGLQCRFSSTSNGERARVRVRRKDVRGEAYIEKVQRPITAKFYIKYLLNTLCSDTLNPFNHQTGVIIFASNKISQLARCLEIRSHYRKPCAALHHKE